MARLPLRRCFRELLCGRVSVRHHLRPHRTGKLAGVISRGGTPEHRDGVRSLLLHARLSAESTFLTAKKKEIARSRSIRQTGMEGDARMGDSVGGRP